MKKIYNFNLFERDIENDLLYITTREPVIKDHSIQIDVILLEEATVLDSAYTEFPEQCKVSEIRKGDGEKWLLSGGALLKDCMDHYAMGLRDCNAADPLSFTNIAAGRCDRKLFDHCIDELTSELILCVYDRNVGWMQLSLGSHTPDINNLQLPVVKNNINMIRHEINESQNCPKMIPYHIFIDHDNKLYKDIIISWIGKSGKPVHTEELSGYILLDNENKTTEFRLPIAIDISNYAENKLFFAEGTGYAEWMTFDQIAALYKAEISTHRKFLTPFMRSFLEGYKNESGNH